MDNLVHGRTVVYNVNYHIVWSTKYRKPVLVGNTEKALRDIFINIAETRNLL